MQKKRVFQQRGTPQYVHASLRLRFSFSQNGAYLRFRAAIGTGLKGTDTFRCGVHQGTAQLTVHGNGVFVLFNFIAETQPIDLICFLCRCDFLIRYGRRNTHLGKTTGTKHILPRRVIRCGNFVTAIATRKINH